jgi:hypothetical protein
MPSLFSPLPPPPHEIDMNELARKSDTVMALRGCHPNIRYLHKETMIMDMFIK